MIEETDFKTYLTISSNQLGIYLFHTKNFNYLYQDHLLIDTKIDLINFSVLDEFLEKNIFKIEKLIGKFINNIYLIIQTKKTNKINLGIKKKNYDENIKNTFLESILIDAKDLFKENYPDVQIMHMVINKYIVDGISYRSFQDNFVCDDFCLELHINFIPKNFVVEIDKVLEKYQIKIIDYLDEDYIESCFKNEKIELCMKAYKIQNGFNINEVKLVPKKFENKGFFEKFFQLFS
tara:strand:+ start:42 stop:746 length:705 start_codon:yes stop_codon:yes gene_type:complete